MTEHDGKMTLRLFGQSDDLLLLLLRELGLLASLPRTVVSADARLAQELACTWPKVSRALVPYDAQGRRLLPYQQGRTRPQRWMWLDLSDGAGVRLCDGESKRLVVESPWSQFTSECQRF
jgi:hypothetical protein